MGISSLGTGSGILTQSVLDKLRAADESGTIKPLTYKIASATDKQGSIDIIKAGMNNVSDQINSIKSATVWDSRAATITSGTSVGVTVLDKTDVQDFSLNVTSLATKQVEQSGSFAASTTIVDAAAGSLNISLGGGTPINIAYNAGATLDDIKNLINANANSLVNATIVQVATGDTRLFLSSAKTGANSDIKITSASGLDTKLTTGFDAVAIQTGSDAAFSFNGQNITRSSNVVNDLITGATITLKEVGASNVSIKQDRTSILGKFDSFVQQYNANLLELDKQTKNANDSTRGIFAADSAVKDMKRAVKDMIGSVGGGVGSLIDYGFSIDKTGQLSLDKTALEAKMDANPANVQAFFSGGDFKNTNGTISTISGSFTEMSTIMDSYTKANKSIDQIREAIVQNISNLNDSKTNATARLDSKYAILKKKFAAYDAIIAKLNRTSTIFTQLANQKTN